MFPRVEVCSFVSSTIKLSFHVSFPASFPSCYSRLKRPILSIKNIMRETGVVDYYPIYQPIYQPLRSGRIWHKVNLFKRSLKGLNSEFSFS